MCPADESKVALSELFRTKRRERQQRNAEKMDRERREGWDLENKLDAEHTLRTRRQDTPRAVRPP